MRALPLAFLVLLVLPSSVSGIGVGAGWEGVLVIPGGLDDVLVAWTPGPEGATYRVYGETPTSTTFLTETADASTVVDAGFKTYVVETILNGTTVEVRRSNGLCVAIVHGIPPTVLIYDCSKVLTYKRP